MYKHYAQIRDEKGLKDADVARMTGITRANFSQWKSGLITPKYQTMEKIAAALGVSVEYLLTGGMIAEVKQGVSVPVLGYVAAGVPIEAITDYIGEVTISPALAKKGKFFALKIKGDSMAPQILQGDIVVCMVQNTAETGDIVIVQVNGSEATCKKVQILENGILLQPLNPAYGAVFYSAAEVMEKPVTIIGKVMESRRSWD